MFEWMFGKNTLKDTADAIGGLAKDVRQAITGEVSEEGKLKMIEVESKLREAQTAINLKEAEHKSIFVSGWRPAVGWVCVLGLFYKYILNPVLTWVCLNIGWTAPPYIHSDDLITLLVSLLGLGGLRTMEKYKGVSRS